MTMTTALVEIAGLIIGAPACTSRFSSCDGFVPTRRAVDVGGDVACAIADEANLSPQSASYAQLNGQSCATACAGMNCTLPGDYVAAYLAAQSTAGDGGAIGCPAISGSVAVTCSSICEGRRTRGIAHLRVRRGMSIGDYFSACCYLEATSVHAFARLRMELGAHRAPRRLLRAAKRAERDEVRHTELTLALARRFGVESERPRAPSDQGAVGALPSVRSLFEIARENAVEGCVRETYGAIVALVRSARAKDRSIRETMGAIARDECKHAELSWRVAAWIMPQLKRIEREKVERSMRASLRELARTEEVSSTDCQSFLGLPSSSERQLLVMRLANVLQPATRG